MCSVLGTHIRLFKIKAIKKQATNSKQVKMYKKLGCKNNKIIGAIFHIICQEVDFKKLPWGSANKLLKQITENTNDTIVLPFLRLIVELRLWA